MKIESLRIEGFGIISGQAIESMSPGLTVICADNGGGKTTLRGFLRAAFFGFATKDNRYAPPLGSVHGGMLKFVLRNGQRYSLGFDARARRSTVTAADGGAAPELSILLGSASLELYRNVFAIGLHELQDAKNLDDDKVRTLIGAFGSGRSGQVFSSARKAFGDRAGALFLPRGSRQTANLKLAELAQKQERLRELSNEADHYWSLQEKYAMVRDECEAARLAEAVARQSHRHADELAKAWPHFVALRNAQAQLAALPLQVEDFPRDGLADLRGLNARLRTLSEDSEKHAGLVQARRREREALVVPELLLQHSAALDVLAAQVGLYQQSRLEAQNAVQEVELRHGQQAAAMAQLGQGWDAGRVASFDLSVASEAERSEAGNAYTQNDTARRAVVAEHDHLAAEAAALAAEAEAGHADLMARWPAALPTVADLDGRGDALGQLRNKLMELERVGDREAQFARELEGATAQIEIVHQRAAAASATPAAAVPAPLHPMRKFCGVAVVFLVLALLFLKTPVAAAVLALCGLFVAVGLWSYKFVIPAVATTNDSAYALDQLQQLQRAATAATESIATEQVKMAVLREECAQLASPFGGRAGTLAHCDELQRGLRKATETRREYDAAAQAVEKLEEAAAIRARAAHESAARLARLGELAAMAAVRWSGWLGAHALPAATTPAVAEQLCRQVRVTSEAVAGLANAQAKLRAAERQVADFETGAAGLFAAIGRTGPAAAEVPVALRALADERDAGRIAQGRLETLLAEAPELEAAGARLQQQSAEVSAARLALLSAAAAATEAEFEARGAAWQERQRLLLEATQPRHGLEALAGPGDRFNSLLDELAQVEPSGLQDESRRLAQELAIATATLEAANRSLGEIDEARRRLASSDDLAACNSEITALTAELRDLGEAWAINSLAAWLMDQACAKYEIERQPAVLVNAGRYLSTMSGGAITRIIKPLDSEHYRLQCADESFKDDDSTWNTALKEQTYLSLRFGLIDAYCAGSESLPIIIDDALVNLDPANLERAVSAINELAQSHQVLYLTCHPQAANGFRTLAPPPRFVHIEGGIVKAG